jgi:hypothetical protein
MAAGGDAAEGGCGFSSSGDFILVSTICVYFVSGDVIADTN